jgi:hypothetical protein
MIGEYVGTTMFLLLALGGTNVANIPQNSVTGATVEGQDGTAAAAVNVSLAIVPMSDSDICIDLIFLLADLLFALHCPLFRFLSCSQCLDLLPVSLSLRTESSLFCN